MKDRLLILCSGQGNQTPAMFDLARTDNSAEVLLDSFDLAFTDIASTSQLIYTNRIAQPMIVASALSIWEAIKRKIPAPSLVAGYSIGELAAYSVAGMLNAKQAVDLARTRAGLMDACLAESPQQVLAAINGLSIERTQQLIDPFDFHLAIITGEDSCIVGGQQSTFSSIGQAVPAAGGKIQSLPVDIASHTPKMAHAVSPFLSALKDIQFTAASCPVLSGIEAIPITDKIIAITHLSRQLAEPIQWSNCMDACAEAGVTVALELGPGSALSRMLQTRHPQIACRSVADFRSIDGIVTWLKRQFD